MSLFGHNRDDRRRRVLAEELAGDSQATANAAPKSDSKTEKAERYTAAARRENHRRTTDMVPRGVLPLVIWYVLGLGLAAGLLAGFTSLANSGVAQTAGVADLLDASQGGSLAGWFSSLAFILSAVGSVLIYSVRRHKLDDYRGRYRLWLWCAAAWIVMSIDATANLHAPFSRAMARASGWSMLPDGAVWWVGIWGVVLSILSLRMILEMRECRLALLALIAVDLLWVAALVVDFGWAPAGFGLGEHQTLWAIGLRLVAQVTLLLAIGLYARHVLLDAEGLLKFRAPKPKREKPAKKAKPEKTAARNDDDKNEASAKSTRIDASHKGTTVSGNSGNSNSSSSSYSANRYDSDDEDDDQDRYKNRGYEDDEDDSYSDGDRKLSKAERKRIRKQMRRQQREDER